MASPQNRRGWTKETHWTVPTDWWGEIFAETRVFDWNVTIVRFQSINPFGSSNYIPSSPSSATRSFIWN